MSLTQKLARLGHVSDDILGFITVRTWEAGDRQFITEVLVDGKRQARKVTKGSVRAAKQHNEVIGEVYRLYGGVWAPGKYQGDVPPKKGAQDV